jgi:hypothetical protein
VSEWMPIETAPRDGTSRLLWDKRVGTTRVGWWSLVDECWDCTDGWSEIADVTHWQPLPEPPSASPE